jgi:hypothetical protein
VHIVHILHIDAFICFACRHCLRPTQPVYGFWYYFMIHRGIGVTLQKLMPKLVPRNDKDVDALLDCKLRVYVLIFCIFCIFCIFYLNLCQAQEERYRRQGNPIDRPGLPSFH